MRPAVGLVLALLASAACSYDWATGAGAADAGTPDGTVEDAAADATVDVEVEGAVDGGGDAGVDAEASLDAPADVPAEASFCQNLENQVAGDKTNAINCLGVANSCLSSIKDQCDCTVFVAQGSGPATSTYVNDLHELEDSGCPLGCGSCGTPPTSANCLAGPNGTAICTPFP